MTWAQTAKRYLAAFQSARETSRIDKRAPVGHGNVWGKGHAFPKCRLAILSRCATARACSSMPSTRCPTAHMATASTTTPVPCCCRARSRGLGESRLSEPMTASFAAFIQHAWNPDTRRFRNFMSYDRRWLEAQGSEDSHGRTLWALGECARSDTDPSRRRWAAALFKTALPAVEQFRSPRAWAFTLLGLDAYCALVVGDLAAGRMREVLVDRLAAAFHATESKDWCWFEDVLAYDNARLSQAMLVTGAALKRAPLVEIGLASLRWLMALQTTPDGYFRPVGTESFGVARKAPQAFDQQPVEAAAAISACLAAWRVNDSAEWTAGAMCAFDWFVGGNDLQTSLIDPDTGGCLDGLHPDRPNENKGAESAVSYLLGLAEVRQFARAAEATLASHTSWLSAPEPGQASQRAIQGGHFVSTHVLEPTDFVSASGPARVVVRPFKPAIEPRDLNPTDKTRANHIVGRVLGLEPDAAEQQLKDVLENFEGRHRNLLEIFETRAVGDGRRTGAPRRPDKDTALSGRCVFSSRVLVRSIGLVQSEYRPASRPVRRARWRMPIHSEPSGRRRRPHFIVDLQVRIYRRGWQCRHRPNGAPRVRPKNHDAGRQGQMVTISR